MRSDTADLEILDFDSQLPASGAAPGPSRRRRRWPWAAVGAAVLAGAVVLPVRANVAGSQFRRLAGVWARAEALEPSRLAAVRQLTAATVTQDRWHLVHGTAALDETEAAQLVRLRSQLNEWLVPDGQIEGLRVLMRQTLTDEIADLRAAAVTLRTKADTPDLPFRPATVTRQDAVAQRVHDLTVRFDQRSVAAPVTGVLPGAEADLAALGRYLDEPTGTLVAATDGAGRLSLVDLDHSRATTLDLGANTSASRVVARLGFLAVLAQTPGATLVLAIDPAGGAPRILARQASAIAAAPEPDRLWVQTVAGGIEVDGTGALVAGPIALPADAELAGASTTSLFSQRQDGGLLVTSASKGTSQVLALNGELIAASGSNVAWAAAAGDPNQLSVTVNVSADGGQTSRILPNAVEPRSIGGWFGIGPGAFSPDGHRLALWWLGELNDIRPIVEFGVVNLDNGHNQMAVGFSDGTAPVAAVWAPNGAWVLFVRGNGTNQLWAYQPGQVRAEAVRIRGTETDDIAALAAPRA